MPFDEIPENPFENRRHDPALMKMVCKHIMDMIDINAEINDLCAHHCRMVMMLALAQEYANSDGRTPEGTHEYLRTLKKAIEVLTE